MKILILNKWLILIIMIIVNLNYIYAENSYWKNYTYCVSIIDVKSEDSVIWVGSAYCGIMKIEDTIKTYYNKANSDLPDNAVSSIAIDANGNKWIGTYDGGIAKFDNYNWTIFNSSNSGLPHNRIFSISIDSNGIKWIGTTVGLVRFDDSLWTVYNTSNSDIPNNSVNAIVFDTVGNKWLGTNGGLAKFDNYNFTVYSSVNLPFNWINSLAFDKNGGLWVGTYSYGLALFEGNNWNIIYNTSNSGLPHNKVNFVTIDSKGTKWIATDGGIAIFDDTNWTIYNNTNSGLPVNKINTINISSTSEIWIGTSVELVKYNGINWILYISPDSGLRGNQITTIFIDKDNLKWIGTQSSGLSIFDGNKTWYTYNTNNSDLPDNGIYSIAIDTNGDFWIGTKNGLAVYDGTNWTIYNTSNSILPDNFIRYIAIEPNGTKWISTFGVGTSGGIVKIENNNWTVYNTSNSDLPDNKTSSIIIDKSGIKWFGNSGGLVRFDDNNWTIYNTSNSGIPVNGINSIELDQYGNKWIGTWNGGLVKFNDTNWTVYNTSNSEIPDNYVFRLAFDFEGNLWIGTFYNGLAKFDGSDWTVYHPSNSPLTNVSIMSLAIDNDDGKWIGTNRGLSFLGNYKKDIKAENYFQDTDSICGSFQSNLYVILENKGNLALTDFEVTAIISGSVSDTLSVVFTDIINPDESEVFNIGVFNSSQGGDIDFYLYTSLNDDFNRNNDTLKFRIYFFEMPSIPNVADDTLCSVGIVTLSGNNTSSFTKWYSSPTSFYAIDSGNSFTTPYLTSSTFFYVKNFSENGCYSDRKEVKIVVYPELEGFKQGALFEGLWNEGTFADPDALCSGNTNSYEIFPPIGYSNKDYGNKWSVSVSLKTLSGNTTSNLIVDDTSLNKNILLTFNSSLNDADSIFILSAIYFIYPSQCSDTISRFIFVNTLPDANFTYVDTSTKVNFFPNITSYGVYQWEFGDGNKSTVIKPEHVYDGYGNYDVSLKVQDTNNCFNEEIINITLTSTNVTYSDKTESISLKVFPNPFTNEILITYELYISTEIEIRLFDLNGKLIYTIENSGKTIGNHSININTIDLNITTGVYVLHIQTLEEIIKKRVIKSL